MKTIASLRQYKVFGMTTPIADDLEAKLLKTATDCQQNFYELSSDWNRFQKNEYEYIRDHVGVALFGSPSYEENKDDGNADRKNYNWEPKQLELINPVFDKIIEYGSGEQSEGIILCATIYNVIYNKKKPLTSKKDKKSENKEEKNEPDDTNKDENKDEELEAEACVYPVPIFRVRKYQFAKTKKEKEAANEPIMEKIYFIDGSARVYDGFMDYLKDNKLPDCTMVVPKDGFYQGDPGVFSREDFANQNIDTFVSKVWLDVLESPAGKVAAKLAVGGDIASTIFAVAGMGVGIASMITPIGPTILAASAVGGAVSGLWSVGRSAQQLADRGQHGESINVTDRAALGAWIGIAGGTMGVAATGGTMLLARAVRTGTTVGRAAMVAHDAVVIGNLIINGVGVSYKSFDLVSAYIKDGTTPSATDVFFLTTHIFFFCNSVMNIQLARNFIENSQGQFLKDYEASLRSNRHRKEFQKMARNTRAAGANDVASNEEIIRGINKIVDKDEFFQSMVRNRKAFSASGAKASFVDGKVTVNNALTIDPIEFANLPIDVRADIVRGVAASVPPSNSMPVRGPNAVHVNNEVSWKNFTAGNKVVLNDFCARHSNALLQTAGLKIGDFEDVLSDLRNVTNSAQIFMKLLEIGYRILQAMPREETTIGNILSIIVQFLWDYVKSNMRKGNSGFRLEDPSAQIVLDKVIVELLYRVEKEVEKYVQAFRKWLENRFRQTIGGF